MSTFRIFGEGSGRKSFDLFNIKRFFRIHINNRKCVTALSVANNAVGVFGHGFLGNRTILLAEI